MKLRIASIFDAPPERVWDEVRTTRLLRHVAAPLIVFDPVEPPVLPEIWPEGRHRVRMRALGILPIGRQWIVTSMPDPEEHARGVYRIRDEGSGDLVRVWDHRIVIRARPDGRTDYADEVEVHAGLLTPVVWLFAHVFYRYRQARWRRLIARGFRYPDDR
jgi:hypothetical protein